MDNFALLKVPRRPWLDPEALKAGFLKLAASLHPDKVEPAERDSATARSAELNAAYRCLADPKERLRHLLELERGTPPQDVQSIPGTLIDLLMAIGKTCRETDSFLQQRAKTSSPLLKVQLFEAGMAWTEKLNQLRQQIAQQNAVIMDELQTMNPAWEAGGTLPLERLEQLYRMLGYMARWSEQIQERLVQLSF